MIPTIKNGSTVRVELTADLAEVLLLGLTRSQRLKSDRIGTIFPLLDGSNFHYFRGEVESIRVQPYKRPDKPKRGKKLLEALVKCSFPLVLTADICSDDDPPFKERDVVGGLAHLFGHVSRPRHDLSPLVVGQVLGIQDLAKVPYHLADTMETYRLITVQSESSAPSSSD